MVWGKVSAWTPQEDLKLAELFASGLSYRAIGAALGKNINQVAGRLTRAKLRTGEARSFKKNVQTIAVEISSDKKAAILRAKPVQTVLNFAPQRIVPPAIKRDMQRSTGITPMTIATDNVIPLKGGCRYPMWGSETPTDKFCDKPRFLLRSSYCTEHDALCVVRRVNLASPGGRYKAGLSNYVL